MSRVILTITADLDDATCDAEDVADTMTRNIEQAIGNGILTDGGNASAIVDDWNIKTEVTP